MFQSRLKNLRKKNNMTQADVAKFLALPVRTYASYENNEREPNSEILLKLADLFNVSTDYLLGNIIMENSIPQFPNIYPLKLKKVPMLGEIACGEPIWANENHGEYVDVDEDIDVDFCLKASGDSMKDARILDGDIVYIKKTPVVENGEIAAVIIDNEATLKRVYYKQEEQELTLVAANPNYEPMTFRGEQLANIRILGKAIVFSSRIRHRE